MKDSKVNLTKDNNKNISIPTNENIAILTYNSKNDKEIAIVANEKNNLYNLTTPQKNIWSMEKYYNGTSLNNVCGSVIIHENIDFDRLKAAVDTLVRMNDAFGIQFVNKNDTIMQFYNGDIVSNFSAEIVEVANNNELKDLEQKLSHIVFDERHLFEIKVFKFPTNEGGVVCAIHHSLSDSWSIGLISKYITEVYSDLLRLKEIPTDLGEFVRVEKEKYKISSYFDFVQKEADYINSSGFSKDKDYWNNLFKTVPELPEFIPMKDKTSTSISACRKSFELSNDLLKKINEFCTVYNISVYNFLMAVYSFYISAISRLDEFVIGTPVLNRRTASDKSTIGMFVSTLPLYVNVNYDLTFTEFCKNISTSTFSAFRHQRYSYGNILSDLRQKHANLPNLYNTVISYQITKTVSDKFNCETYWTFNGCSPDDLQIHIFDYNEKALSVAYDFKNEKFDTDEINNLHKRIISIINTVLDNYEICLNDIDVVTKDEKNVLLNDFNNTYKKFDNKTLSQMFEEQVKKTPNNIAVVFEDKELTYKELNEKVNSLAFYLRKQGVKRNDIVGVMCGRSLEMIISILAVIKSGAACTPIDSSYPKDRIDYMMNTVDAKFLLTQKALEDKIDFKNNVFVDLDNDDIYSLPCNNLKCINEPDDLFYVIFTSGSTGKPKGVMLKHVGIHNLTNYCNDYFKYLQKPSNDAIVSITTISFDSFFLEAFTSFQRGLKLVIANEYEQNTPKLLNDLMNKNDVKVIHTTPSRMQAFLNNLNDFPALKNLQNIVLVGEPLPLTLVNSLRALNNVAIYNGYGPSETTIGATYCEITDNNMSIGKPYYNEQIYILNKSLKPVPVGVAGEICISGVNVGKGYIKNDELTKKSFIANPFISDTIMYRTGDMGAFLPDGRIMCLGRIDNQVKLRGQRVELGEIEERLNLLPCIKTSVVVKKTDENSHEFLCAYFTSNGDADLSIIRKTLESHLPRYMVPQYFIELDALPYTPSGKIDKKSLPLPDFEHLKREIILPRNEIETSLLDLFKQVLHTDVISIDDSFFDIGGDSLSAISLIAKIQDNFNVQLYVKDILENPSIQDLAIMISTNLDDNVSNVIKSVPKSEFYAVSSAQKRMYFLNQINTDSIAYNTAGSVIFDGNVNAKKLEDAFKIVIKRHETLRTYFELHEDEVVQKIVDNIDFELPILNNANYEEIDSLFNDFVKPFDLSKAPLFRAKLIKFTNGKSALFIDCHHIICDGMSSSIFVKELCTIYNGDTLPELSITYKDFACFENERFKSGELDNAENYWLDKFKGEIPVLNMPTQFPRPNVQSHEGQKVYSVIDANTASRIDSVCKDLGVTPYMLMLSAFYILLSKYSSQDDIVVGSPVVGRDIASTYNLIGMFVNTLALRETIDDSVSFKLFVLGLKDDLLEAYKYQTYPFDKLTAKLNIKRDLAHSPLFDVMFIFQNDGLANFELDGVSSNYYVPDSHTSKFDLSLEAIPENGEIKLNLEYCTKLFDNSFIVDFANHYKNILDVVLNNVDIKINDIDMLSVNEKNKILYDFNDTYKKFENKTLSQMFEDQVRKTPNNIAVVFEDKELTYKELNEKVNSLAFYLRKQGVKRNDIVGVMCGRSLEMIISILAVLKSGASYTPIDPTFPKDRIVYMLDAINAKVLLTQKELENHVEFKNILFVDLCNTDIYDLPNENLKNVNEPKDLSYVIFTSGSTGRPKGVMLTQIALTNLANYCNDYIDYLKKPSNMAVVSTTTVSFDIFIFETLISLQRGLKLIISNEDEQNTPSLLNKLISKYDVKAIQATPSRMQFFIQNIKDFPALKSLKYITLAGEQLPQSLVNDLHEFGATVYNGYGPSETTVFSTLTKMSDKTVNIGKPLYNTQIYILDDNLNPVPVGVTGEIYISGDGVARGYINNEELTRNSFIRNPFIANSIMYKTGDLGTYLPDGTIMCSGRVDHQIKIRGQRIELGEIEEQILALSFIKACVVVKQINENSHEFLCAYFTSNGKADLSIMRKTLEEHLPRYMVPQYYIELDDLPYTPSGKIDRKALPLPNFERSKEDIVLPRNDTESRLLELFKQVLHVDIISIDDSFFDIGGDSLSAISLIAKIQDVFNVQLFVKDIIEKQTVRNIAELIDNNSQIETITIDKVENADYYKISSAQKRIYFASQVDGESLTYNTPAQIILDGDIDVKKLEDAFRVVVERHEPLRTCFELHENEVVQKIVDNVDFKLDTLKDVDYKDLDSLFNDFVKPFDLSKAPLLRAKLVKFTNGKSALFIDCHHIICDGASIGIFIDELCKAYNGNELPELDITYKDFANFESERLASGALDEAKEYWLDKFKGEIPILNMPTIHPRPTVQSFEGKRVYSVIDADTVLVINSVCKSLGITPYMLLLAVYYILISKYSSQSDIVVGSPVVGRDIASTYNLIGMFVNTLALREKINTNDSFKSFVLALKDDLLNAYKYQVYPFDELVNALDIKKDLARNSLFDVMFTYQNNGFNTFNFDGVTSSYSVPDIHTSKFDLSLEAVPKGENINLSFEYSTQLFNKDFIKSLSNHYLNILKLVLNNIDVQISKISLLSSDEEFSMLSKLNDTILDYPKDKRIIDLFEEQVKKTPNDVALVFEDKSYTYLDLNDRVNRLANHIRKLPVFKKIAKDEVRAIGIMMNRRAEILISMLAILKTGCAYLPIDPTYPEDRVSYIIDNSGIKLILTEQILSSKFVSSRSRSTEFKGFPIDIVITDEKSVYEDFEDFDTPSTSDDLAYIIYTSGSTGSPKGVMIKESNVVNLIYSIRHIFPLKNKTIVSITTMCFDIFVFESLLSVCSRVKIIFTNNDEQNSPILLNELCKKHNVNMIQATPSKFNFLISDESNLDYIRNMKLIILTGEALPQNLLNKVKSITSARIFDMYGPTETTVWSTYKELTDEKQITIGKPISNTQVYILDNDLNLLPTYVPGKLFIGGDGVTDGYLKNHELTIEKFIEYNGNIIYDTGDLAKLNANNEVVCLGRSDFQVKIRGLRIELSEIEKQITSYQGVSDAVVVVKSINDRDVLCGYFVASGRVSISLLRDKLSKKLPTYMIPTHFMQLKSFEHTPNGKIDRKKLPLPTITNKEIVAPRTYLQNQLLLIWKNILSIDEISINDNFFEIGGDSLCALKLQLELMKININIQYGDIFKNNTIELLSDFIENMSKDEEEPTIYHSYNFFKANKALWRNNDKFKLHIKEKEIKNVLLLGATGYLGAHILAELLKIDNIKVYCLVRNDPSTSAENKLKNKLKFYFGSDLSSLFGDRIIVVPGEVTEDYFGLSESVYKKLAESVYTVINSAAIVKHFGKYEVFEKVNVTSVKNTVTFCEKYGKDLIHISTLSVAGTAFTWRASTFNPNKQISFAENKLFIKQSLKNVYVRSKFEAEKFVLEELANKKLRGIILRVGNVTNRYLDGKFQENSNENAFNNRLKAFMYLKMVPKSICDARIEFSPVDILAQAIIEIMKFYTPSMSILHMVSDNELHIMDLVNFANQLRFNIKVVEDDIFKKNLKKILFNSPNYDKVSALLNDMDDDYNLVYKTNIILNHDFTSKFFDAIGFKWPEITKDYIKKILDML